MHVHVCVCVCACMHACVCVCVCVVCFVLLSSFCPPWREGGGGGSLRRCSAVAKSITD